MDLAKLCRACSMEIVWKLFRSEAVLLICHMLFTFPWPLWVATLPRTWNVRSLWLGQMYVGNVALFQQWQFFFGHTHRSHCLRHQSMQCTSWNCLLHQRHCEQPALGCKVWRTSVLFPSDSKWCSRRESFQEGPVVIWLAGKGNALYFPAALASWVMRTWRGSKSLLLCSGIEKGRHQGCVKPVM